MKKILLLGLFGFIVSCSNVQNSEYEGNLEIAKEWFEVFVTEDFEALTDFYADAVWDSTQVRFRGLLIPKGSPQVESTS